MIGYGCERKEQFWHPKNNYKYILAIHSDREADWTFEKQGEEIRTGVSDTVSLKSLVGMQMKMLSEWLNIQACFSEEQFGLERLYERPEHIVDI